MRNFLLLAGIMSVGYLMTSCSKPSLVGSELLEDELSEVQYIDTFDLEFSAVAGDSILTYSQSAQLSTFLCGKLDDPIFGHTNAEIFTQFRTFDLATSLINSTIAEDGVTLRLRYDTSACYGALDEEVTIEVFEITERPLYEESYYADHRFETTMMPIGSATFVPNVRDSVEVTVAGDTVLLPPHAAIPITDFSFRERLINADSATLLGIDSFQNIFRGLNIRMTMGSKTMLAFRLSSGGTALQVEYNTLADPDVDRLYEFLIDPNLDVKTVYFGHDYTGAPVEQYIGNEELGDNLLFIQSMAGLNERLRIVGLEELEDVLINHAEIILYEATLPEDDTLFSQDPIRQLGTRVALESGRLVNSRDVSFSLTTSGGSLARFGGAYDAPDEGNNAPAKYVMNTTAQVQAIVNGEAENEIFISSFGTASNARRVILYGPEHTDYPARLRLTLTKVQK